MRGELRLGRKCPVEGARRRPNRRPACSEPSLQRTADKRELSPALAAAHFLILPSSFPLFFPPQTPTPLMQYRGGPKFPPSVVSSAISVCSARLRSATNQRLLPQGLFCRHHEVFDYLEDFSKPLLPYIRFNTRVLSLRHTLASDPPAATTENETLGFGREGPHGRRRWIAFSGSTIKGASEVDSDQFDVVFIANGKYSEPYIPRIAGLSTFTGSLLHAKWYRSPEQFPNKVRLAVYAT